MTRGPQPQRRVAVALLVVATLLPIAPAAAVSAASPTDGLPIHGQGSDAGLVTTPAGTKEGMALAVVGGPAACTGWASETVAPQTIRVYRTRTDTVETLDFRAYMRKVVTGEFKRTWPFELLSIGAIAAKQNAWYWSMRGRDWGNLANWGGRAHPIQRVELPTGEYQWQTTDASSSGPGLCWDLTDNPGIDQCYDCQTTPVDPASAPRNQAALDATWSITMRRPRAGVQSFFAPGYAGRKTATCPSMASQADWESWFNGNIDFNQAYVCATANGESAEMLLRRFLSSALEIRDPTRADLTGDGLGDVPILRSDPSGSGLLAFEPATADPAYIGSLGGVASPTFQGEIAPSIARAVGRLDRTDRASLVTLTVDPSGSVAVVARSLDGPGALRETTWWSGSIPGLDPTSTLDLSVADVTGDMRGDLVLVERAPTRGPDGLPVEWSLRAWVLPTTDTGAGGGFSPWASFGPFPKATRFERIGDVDANGRADLVFAPGDSTQFLVARASRGAGQAFDAPEPYGAVAAPVDSTEWRYFALADVAGTGVDEPVVGSIAGGLGLSLQNAAGATDPVGWSYTVGPLVPTWTGPDPSLASGLLWTGDVDADARAETGIVNATFSTGPILAAETAAARLAVVGVRTGVPPASMPVIAGGALETLTVVAPGSADLIPANSTLRRLALTVGTLSPDFSADTSAYTVIVSPAVASLKLRATATRPWARVTVKGKAVKNGSLVGPIALKLGANRIPIVVTDATSRTRYDLTVIKAAKPPAPRVTKYTAPVGGKLRVWWASAGNGGSPITSWVVQYRLTGTSKWTVVRVDSSTATNVIVRDLPVGKTFDIRVAARNIVGVGAYTPRLTLKTR